ncbi:MAG: hypothetical protein BGP09_33400 [Rhizobium sp. 60-20]|nr:MAG: hypothetical protein BGP09_33400 [Rhizobium sp. 60-20]
MSCNCVFRILSQFFRSFLCYFSRILKLNYFSLKFYRLYLPGLNRLFESFNSFYRRIKSSWRYIYYLIGIWRLLPEHICKN